MLKRIVGVTIATVVGCGFFATHAAADPVQCGDVITESIKLEADLTDCPDDGLVVGADRITINLNGHEVSSACVPNVDCAGKVGIDNSGGHDRVRIRNGTVDGFERTILLVGANRNTLAQLDVGGGGFDFYESRLLVLEDSDRNVVRDSEFGGGQTAVLLTDSDRNRIVRSRMRGLINTSIGIGLEINEGSDANAVIDSEVGGLLRALIISNSTRTQIKRSDVRSRIIGIHSEQSDRTVLVGNTVNGGMGTGIEVFADRATIRGNEVFGRGAAILIEGDRNLIAANRAEGEFEGAIEVLTGDRNLVRGNQTTQLENDFARPVILIAAPASRTSVIRNSATRGDDDGIRIDSPGTLVRGNTANDNAALGINAVDGVIDGGDNHASGNGDPRQCVGVICTP